MHHAERFNQLSGRQVFVLGQFLDRIGEIARLIEIPDNYIGRAAQIVVQNDQAQLRFQIVRQRDGRRQERLEEGLSETSAAGDLNPGVKVLVEEAAKIDLVERVGGRRRLRRRGQFAVFGMDHRFGEHLEARASEPCMAAADSEISSGD